MTSRPRKINQLRVLNWNTNDNDRSSSPPSPNLTYHTRDDVTDNETPASFPDDLPPAGDLPPTDDFAPSNDFPAGHFQDDQDSFRQPDEGFRSETLSPAASSDSFRQPDEGFRNETLSPAAFSNNESNEQMGDDMSIDSPSHDSDGEVHGQGQAYTATDSDGDSGGEDDEDLFIVFDSPRCSVVVLIIAQPIGEVSRVPQESRPLTFLELLEDLNASSDEDEQPASPSPSPEPQDLERTPLPVLSHQAQSPAPSPTPSFEIIVQQGGKDTLPPPLHLALGLWFEKSGGSRADYVRLREVFQLSKPSAAGSSMVEEGNEDSELDMHTLPLKLDTLKRQIRRHIPLLQLLRKPLTVMIEKQPSLPQREKGMQRQSIERQAWQYWYEPLDLIRTILSATYLREKMFFGMAQYVDEPTELWQSHAWGSSIRSTSGEVCHTQKRALIIPGDLVRIRSSPYRIGRVIFIGRDYRQGATGHIVITLQAVADHGASILDSFDLNLDNEHELFLIEDVLLEQTPQSITRHLDIYYDRDFGGDEEEVVYPDDRRFIRRVLNFNSSTIRPLRQLHPTRGELEIAHFGRDYLEAVVAKSPISFPYLLFVDDFGIHRNMYRALKAFYLIPACLDYAERRKLANVFTLSLGPHGANIKDVVEAFRKPIQDLDRGIELEVNGVTDIFWAFALTFLGDMPQQADNGGFMRHTATMGCRTCYCSKDERANLDFDIVGNGRYHWETTQQREFAGDLDGAELKEFIQDTGIRLDAPPIAKLAPSLDLIQSRAYDAPHSEWRGLGRILQGFLMTTILTKRKSTTYLKAF
ncbi:hypothetical protein HO173_013218 [Letharia columbiana]|uniref:Uncharacterized protein n=1 Tax=Letharia columbiana TaxID=112416 RepID=A0A8H6CHU2_9LECA|nr:uncharacterized protein HO173_013218 [Letharia columbiana]KAF6223757.1 hypothetical protein HO173_013218 [Letharia columbiana]